MKNALLGMFLGAILFCFGSKLTGKPQAAPRPMISVADWTGTIATCEITPEGALDACQFTSGNNLTLLLKDAELQPSNFHRMVHTE